MQRFSFECPANPSSMGQMGAGILAELYRRDIQPHLFPIGNIDLSQFSIPDQGFVQWLDFCVRNAPVRYNRDNPSLRYFHVSQSLGRLGNFSRLYTVHETDELTLNEVNILKQHDSIMVPSAYNQEVFAKYGISSEIARNYFDSRHIYKIDRKPRDYVTWGLIGKMEKRKNTAKIIDTWVKKFGGNKEHRLNLNISNMFLFQNIPPENRLTAQKQMLESFLKYELPWNCNMLPFLNQEQLNQCYNEIDVDLSGLSGAEGTNLPFLNTRCLSKRGISLNAHSHKDYATSENSILVEPIGKKDIFDGQFYRQEIPYNHGKMFDFDAEEVAAAMDKALAASEPDEQLGKELAEKYSVKNCVDKLLEGI